MIRQILSRMLTPAVAGIALTVALAGTAAAQDQAEAAQAARAAAREVTPLRLEVVISRLPAQGTTPVSRMPYTFSVLPSGSGATCRLRMGAHVPVEGPGGSLNYQDVGTNIDCTVIAVGNDRFQINLAIEETSVYEAASTGAAADASGRMPVFRTYQSTNTVVLRDGETTRFTGAPDRITGESVVAEVKLTVLK